MWFLSSEEHNILKIASTNWSYNKSQQSPDTAGKMSIEHATIFPSKYISKGAVDMKFSPDFGNIPSNPYMQRKQNK